MAADIAQTVWRKHKVWSVTAGQLKRGISRLRSIILLLGIGGAALETLSTQVPQGAAQQGCAWLGAVCLGIIPVLTHRLLTPAKMRAWVRARSASEGLKAEVYTYSAQAAPYDGPPEAAETVLQARAKEIEDAVDDLSQYAALVTPPDSAPPGPLTPEAYLDRRIMGQVKTFYRPKARVYARRAQRFRTAELGLALTAAIVAAATGVWGHAAAIGAWVAVITTVGGALTAHVSASRLDFLVTSYWGTKRRLEELAAQWPPKQGGGVPSPEWSDFVRRCESAISTENETWLAKWSKEDEKSLHGRAGE
jgi:SMODS and SLOG-associating 2TM effector domain 1/Protein of unknown function (DUF4231)